MLSKATLERQERRYRWAHDHRKQILVFGIVFSVVGCGAVVAAAIDGVSVAGIVGPIVPEAVLLVSLRKAQAKEPDPRKALAAPRAHALRWQGLLEDGSLDPHPDIVETLAGLPSWMVTVLAVLELTIGAAIVVGVVVGVGLSVTRGLHGAW
jgi:hypothetical protein